MCGVAFVGGMGLYTSHTRGLAGFWGPGGSVVEGSWSLGSRVAGEEGPPFGDLYSMMWLSNEGRGRKMNLSAFGVCLSTERCSDKCEISRR